MDTSYSDMCLDLESQLRKSLLGRRYSSTVVFDKLCNTIANGSVRFFPMGERRIINIGNRGKLFVLQYAREVRICSVPSYQDCSSLHRISYTLRRTRVL